MKRVLLRCQAPAGVQAWMESAGLHHITTADGAVLICLDSMLKQLHKNVGRRLTLPE
jgi:hypothetical protein